LILDRPTVGVAKSLLCGRVEPAAEEKWAPIRHEGRVVGAAVVTKAGVKPVYVSVGHRVSLRRAIEIVLNCTRKYRLPEPIRKAHQAAEIKRRPVYGA